MYEQNERQDGQPQEPRSWQRQRVAQILDRFREQGEFVNVNEFATSEGVPRSTLRHWLQRQEAYTEHPQVVAFFESEAGLYVLHRLVTALHLMLPTEGRGGVRCVSQVLAWAGLSSFVATSVGVQHQLSRAVCRELRSLGDEETRRLAPTMRRKRISLCGDETFHCQERSSRPCLVAIEPVSNFIVLEAYANKRDAVTWRQELTQVLEPLRVDVVQFTSDQARALKALCHQPDWEHSPKGWHHSPDLMHVKQPLTRRSRGAAMARVQQQSKRVCEAREVVGHCEEVLDASPSNSLELRGELMAAEFAYQAEEQALHRRLSEWEELRELQHEFSDRYHPFELDSGAVRDAAQLELELEEVLEDSRQQCSAMELGPKVAAGLEKMAQMVVAMVSTLSFFWSQVAVLLEEAELDDELSELVQSRVMAAEYAGLAAGKARNAEQRHELNETRQRLLDELDADPMWQELDENRRAQLRNLARDCACLWQRSSSCTEGRNGVLALAHHGVHRLSPERLGALTVIHNFLTQRSDGSTPASRFFEQEHRDLFEVLLTRLKMPPRPAKKRRPPQLRRLA